MNKGNEKFSVHNTDNLLFTSGRNAYLCGPFYSDYIL
jgi:hypothetical protein